MTNELPHNKDVVPFYKSWPKFYNKCGKKRPDGREFNLFKVMGITMDRCVEKCFGQRAFRNLVLSETHSLKSPYQSLRWCIKTGKLTNQHCKKTSGVISCKLIFSISEGSSVPYGYHQSLWKKIISSNVLIHSFHITSLLIDWLKPICFTKLTFCFCQKVLFLIAGLILHRSVCCCCEQAVVG